MTLHKQVSIPTAKASYKKQFTEAMVQMGIDHERYYEIVGLPAQDPDDLNSLVPLKPIYIMANMVALSEQIQDFGSQVARIKPWHKIETLGRLLEKSQTLEELLVDFCKFASDERALADFQLNHIDDTYWFGYHGPNIIKSDIQMELYRLTGMIQLVQLAAGKTWIPQRVDLRMLPVDMDLHCNLIAGSKITFGCSISRFCIPNTLLRLPLNIEIAEYSGSGFSYDINAEFPITLKQIIHIYLHQPCKIQTIANMMNLSVRTLQRRLEDHNTSFEEVYREARFEVSKNMLENSSAGLETIAARLGFTETTNFIRAFKGWSGVTPTEHRKSVHSQWI